MPEMTGPCPKVPTVTLNGIVIDAGGSTPTYSWSHDSSLAIRLANSASLSTAFTAPEVDADTAITFTLTADDGTVTATDSLVVTVTDGPILNNPPVADAGRDQAVQEGRTVTLNGAATESRRRRPDVRVEPRLGHGDNIRRLPAGCHVRSTAGGYRHDSHLYADSQWTARPLPTDAVLVTVKDVSGDSGLCHDVGDRHGRRSP